MYMNLGHRHQSLRRKGTIRTHQKNSRMVFRVDALIYVIAALSMLSTFDQIHNIWVDHNAAGVSFVTWAFYALSACVWFAYGIIHKEKVIVVTNCVWILLNLAVAVGVLVYQ